MPTECAKAKNRNCFNYALFYSPFLHTSLQSLILLAPNRKGFKIKPKRAEMHDLESFIPKMGISDNMKFGGAIIMEYQPCIQI